MFRSLGFACALTVSAAQAQTTDDLYDTLQMDAYVEIMVDEALNATGDLEATFLGGSGGPAWEAAVTAIFDAEVHKTEVRAAFNAALADADIAALHQFWSSPTGQSVLEAELAARTAMSDEDVEEAARFAGSELAAEGSDLFQEIQALSTAFGLIDRNVEVALNTQLRFFLAFGARANVPTLQDEGQVVAMIWAQEGEIRADIILWLNGFGALAYTALDPELMQAYIAYAQTDAAQDLNTAIFSILSGASQDMTEDIGFALGTLVSESTL